MVTDMDQGTGSEGTKEDQDISGFFLQRRISPTIHCPNHLALYQVHIFRGAGGPSSVEVAKDHVYSRYFLRSFGKLRLDRPPPFFQHTRKYVQPIGLAIGHDAACSHLSLHSSLVENPASMMDHLSWPSASQKQALCTRNRGPC